MSGASRALDQADFDLERFIDMFDQALTSDDPRVVDALRSLMMMTILTKPESTGPAVDRERGPLRRVIEDINSLARRTSRLEEEARRAETSRYKEQYQYKWDTTPYPADIWKDYQTTNDDLKKLTVFFDHEYQNKTSK